MQLRVRTAMGNRPLHVVAALVRDVDSGLARAGARNAALAVAAARRRQLERDVEDAAAARLPEQASPPTVA